LEKNKKRRQFFGDKKFSDFKKYKKKFNFTGS
jgi:hypothetical protein